MVNGSLAVVPEPSTYAMMGLGISMPEVDVFFAHRQCATRALVRVNVSRDSRGVTHARARDSCDRATRRTLCQ
ncbi:MAG: PEP-CTERM sorting domain-containing protein [Verrucomicrobia bacterium]|nr:PEP-CTERM sorting domain-containing protein [Verrucomicrobiota bacterium]